MRTMERCRGKDGLERKERVRREKRWWKGVNQGKEGTWRKEGKRRGREGKEGKAR